MSARPHESRITAVILRCEQSESRRMNGPSPFEARAARGRLRVTGRSSRRQRLAFSLRQEWRDAEAEHVDAGDDQGGAAEAAELHDQGSGKQRPQEGDKTRRVE